MTPQPGVCLFAPDAICWHVSILGISYRWPFAENFDFCLVANLSLRQESPFDLAMLQRCHWNNINCNQWCSGRTQKRGPFCATSQPINPPSVTQIQPYLHKSLNSLPMIFEVHLAFTTSAKHFCCTNYKDKSRVSRFYLRQANFVG